MILVEDKPLNELNVKFFFFFKLMNNNNNKARLMFFRFCLLNQVYGFRERVR